MDIIAIIGLAMGVGTAFVAMISKHIPFDALLNPAVAVVIVVGTMASVLVSTPSGDLKNLGRLFGVLFGKKRYPEKQDVMSRLVRYAAKARQSGLMSLELVISEEPDPFISHYLQMIVDGVDSQVIEESMICDIEIMQERHAGNAQIFSQAGSCAPALGVLGAVLGLAAAASGLGDSAAISAALSATVWGIFTGYVMWKPMANRLKRKSNLEVQVKSMIMQGICDIASDKTPAVIRDNLMVYLTKNEQKNVSSSVRAIE